MAKARHTYLFRTVWWLPAAVAEVYAVLVRPEDYPSWWPQIRRVRIWGDTRGAMRIRSLLPYDLDITLRAERRDPGAGVLRIRMTGDLHGWAQWTLRPEGTGTSALLEQCVEVRRPLMRHLSLPLRPLFRANHALMMRAGRRGLHGLLGRRRLTGRPEKGFG